MPTCPAGHQSAEDDFCDVCGLAIVSPDAAATEAMSTEVGPNGQPCRSCGAPLAGRFCEACGADSLATAASPATASPTGPPPTVASATRTAPLPMPLPTIDLAVSAASEWTAVISADRAYFDVVQAAEGPDAAAVAFPAYCPERSFPLRSKEISIGRRSTSRGIAPDIDLTGPPEDPGVSRLHAALLAQPGGGWAVVDVGSANGTTLNDDPTALSPNVPRPVAAGDRIHVGAWTTITLRTT
ncbi:hypothetical protein GCM10009765_68930 [Fodinicola feengrottensis]|uniref:FHA domain-containing protein n=1 Tax=Fodinicola feengrottensis TaxID=435914 RepID=A0ABP4UQ99_9ACTN